MVTQLLVYSFVDIHECSWSLQPPQAGLTGWLGAVWGRQAAKTGALPYRPVPAAWPAPPAAATGRQGLHALNAFHQPPRRPLLPLGASCVLILSLAKANWQQLPGEPLQLAAVPARPPPTLKQRDRRLLRRTLSPVTTAWCVKSCMAAPQALSSSLCACLSKHSETLVFAHGSP